MDTLWHFERIITPPVDSFVYDSASKTMALVKYFHCPCCAESQGLNDQLRQKAQSAPIPNNNNAPSTVSPSQGATTYSSDQNEDAQENRTPKSDKKPNNSSTPKPKKKPAPTIINSQPKKKS
jgi:hypothetical protein